MATTSNSLEANPLPEIKRHVTTHDASGNSVYSRGLPEAMQWWTINTAEGHSGHFELGYTTEGLPINMTDEKDLAAFKETYANKQKTGLVRHGGTVLRYCDIPPKSRSPMHRTVSLDYGIVIAGELECLLDSGESRIVRPGDLVIQRGTSHQWLNNTDVWARIVFVLYHAEPLLIGGLPLAEEKGGMGVPASH
ncbi:hypothetical protein B0T11DRAFT_289916 [Plectosphaerella cucumerina]|uniref:Cupin type-2 domain-containing protein n=1 Tax=Plectosphaerella cucumerina TaxID=40658 RepID=A0A8K0WYV1_9PEZI|nr:hypothetical protein B0T11DRAFT_289916 [Plectosphaerella cucumerina]